MCSEMCLFIHVPVTNPTQVTVHVPVSANFPVPVNVTVPDCVPQFLLYLVQFLCGSYN